MSSSIQTEKKNIFKNSNLPIVCIQGLGFVGSAMAAAVASATDSNEKPLFNVIGIDQKTKEGIIKVDSLNKGQFPFPTVDTKLINAITESQARGNLFATTDHEFFSLANTVIVCINMDLEYENCIPYLNFEGLRKSVKILGRFIRPETLVIVESTVPPGTCEKIIAPELIGEFRRRDFSENDLLLAHSYERVMPGVKYLDSIVNFWRVYSGHTERAADECEKFLSKVINVKNYPLIRLASTTASETGKVLENSYRAINIAFMEEWGRFAEDIGIDLFEVIEAIRVRPTHSNMRQPGFGVGGYCLTKDPLFAKLAARKVFGLENHDFPFCTRAIEINNKMPLVSLEKLKFWLRGDLSGKKILLLGISYRQDVGDTRNSPSETFYCHAKQQGAVVICHDPLLDWWPEQKISLENEIPAPSKFDAVVFAVPHRHYKELDIEKWLDKATPLILDANNVLTAEQRDISVKSGCKLICIGRGK